MYYTVALFDPNDPTKGSPRWWKNFLRANPPGNRFNIRVTNDRLMEYSANYVVTGSSGGSVRRYLDFYDQRAYTWFIMRWA